jgi:hypothetical protein
MIISDLKKEYDGKEFYFPKARKWKTGILHFCSPGPYTTWVIVNNEEARLSPTRINSSNPAKIRVLSINDIPWLIEHKIMIPIIKGIPFDAAVEKLVW